MFIRRSVVCLLLLSASIVTATTTYAVPVTPVSYSFDQPTQCGFLCYNDNPNNYTDISNTTKYTDTFVKLTDGRLGNAGWAFNQGREWVGWTGTPAPNIDFNFGTPTHIDAISIGTTQDYLSDVVLPSISIHIYDSNNGGSWTFVQSLVVPPDNANDRNLYDSGPHTFLNLTGLGINTQYIRVVPQYNGPWIFLDEVQFQRPATTVPEPSTWLLIISGLVGLLGYRWRRRQ